MKQELKNHLIPVVVLYVFIAIIWVIFKVPALEFFFSLFGFLFGAFFLDVDHLLYWYYLRPNIEESRLVQTAARNKDYASVLKIFESTHKSHTNLIFHHYFFQVIITLISFFVFTSTSSSFTMSFLLAIYIHLLVDQWQDLRNDPKHLQDWLFAREKKQLPVEFLNQYVLIFSGLTLAFIYLLIHSKI